MDYTTGLSKYFKERFSELGGQIALEDGYMTSDTGLLRAGGAAEIGRRRGRRLRLLRP